MLCPEVSNFPPPKVVSSTKKFESLDKLKETLKLNNFYSSLIITVPDELQIPECIEESVTEDSDYYKITRCSLAEFVEPIFIENFVKKGKLYSLSAERNCMIQNCAAITPEGFLTVHILTYIFQTLGLEGIKRPHNFYEVKIDLTNVTKHEKLKQILRKLEEFDFMISWQPKQENICPSSIAKYFHDKNFKVSIHSLKTKRINPFVTEIPSIKDTELDEIAEWIGMLALGGDLSPTESYISTYGQPESDFALKTGRISLLIVKGLITPDLLVDICNHLQEKVKAKDVEHFWASVSIQSDNNSLWQWNTSSPRMFQAHDSSCNIFITQDCINMFSIGQLKYS